MILILILTWEYSRQLVRMVKFGSREKREAAREASAYLDGFKERIVQGEREIETMLEGLRDEA